ncbi:MAG: ABC transporter ATP-binding protein [Coprococcus sp.]
MQIELKNISKSYNNSFSIHNLDMSIETKQFTTFLGPSGCGKTTILRMIAGLEKPDEGEIWFDDKCVFSSDRNLVVPAEERNLGFVFQDFALWPHMKVYENVAFPLRARKQNNDIDKKVMEALRAVHLEGLENRYPGQLSGGQQQRVAFARAIVGTPQCILFDEPLSALDAILREEMRMEIKRLTTEMGITSIFVTHDQIEAMSMSDNIIVMNHGSVEQSGTPETIYNRPKTKFVANFIGKSNWIDEKKMFRPESASLEPSEESYTFDTKVESQQFLGNMYEIHLNMNKNHWIIQSPIRQNLLKLPVYVKKEKILEF